MIKPKRRYGRIPAATDIARLTADPVRLYTTKGSANPVKELPSADIACPVQNFQKSADRFSLVSFWGGVSVPRGKAGNSISVATNVMHGVYHAALPGAIN
jgi:hypothetical protein